MGNRALSQAKFGDRLSAEEEVLLFHPRKRRASDLSLLAMLQEPVTSNAFRNFMLERFSEELVSLWTDLFNYEKIPYESPSKLARAQEIYFRYFDKHCASCDMSRSEHIDARTVENLRKNLQVDENGVVHQTDITMLAEAFKFLYGKVVTALKFEYMPQFLVSDNFTKLLSAPPSTAIASRDSDTVHPKRTTRKTRLSTSVSSDASECEGKADSEEDPGTLDQGHVQVSSSSTSCSSTSFARPKSSKDYLLKLDQEQSDFYSSMSSEAILADPFASCHFMDFLHSDEIKLAGEQLLGLAPTYQAGMSPIKSRSKSSEDPSGPSSSVGKSKRKRMSLRISKSLRLRPSNQRTNHTNKTNSSIVSSCSGSYCSSSSSTRRPQSQTHTTTSRVRKSLALRNSKSTSDLHKLESGIQTLYKQAFTVAPVNRPASKTQQEFLDSILLEQGSLVADAYGDIESISIPQVIERACVLRTAADLVELYLEIDDFRASENNPKHQFERLRRIFVQFGSPTTQVIQPPIEFLQHHFTQFEKKIARYRDLVYTQKNSAFFDIVQGEVVERLDRHVLPLFRQSSFFARMVARVSNTPTNAQMARAQHTIKKLASFAEQRRFNDHFSYKYTLESALSLPWGAYYLKRFARKRLQEESVLFVLEVNALVKYAAATHDLLGIANRCRRICVTFVDDSAPLQVNISHPQRVNVLKEIFENHNYSPQVFAEAKAEILQILNNNLWPAFQQDSLHENLLKKCTHNLHRSTNKSAHLHEDGPLLRPISGQFTTLPDSVADALTLGATASAPLLQLGPARASGMMARSASATELGSHRPSMINSRAFSSLSAVKEPTSAPPAICNATSGAALQCSIDLASYDLDETTTCSITTPSQRTDVNNDDVNNDEADGGLRPRSDSWSSSSTISTP